MTAPTLDQICDLYRTYADDLREACRQQRDHLDRNPRVRPQLDDVEAEITYLLIRDARPRIIVELGTFYGWSTTWLLSALRDNGGGHLDSYDLVDHAATYLPRTLAADRWTFHSGDIRQVETFPAADFLFIDADHGRRFGRWYIDQFLPRMQPGTRTSVHDVFHERYSRPWSEGREVLRFLDRTGQEHFTTARRRAPDTLTHLEKLRRQLRISGVRGTHTNPMIWFDLP